MIRKYSVDFKKPHKTCITCDKGALFRIDRIISYNDRGWTYRPLTPMSEDTFNAIMKNLPALASMSFEDRKKELKASNTFRRNLRKYPFHTNMTMFTSHITKEEHKLISSMPSGYTQAEIIAAMFRTLKVVNYASYLRRIKLKNERQEKDHNTPRTYSSGYYICSEKCFNLFLLTNS